MNKSTKSLDFSGIALYCGVDVHKRNWRVNIRDNEFELEDYSQNPDAVLLHRHLTRRYPNAKFKVAYEAGFSGFTAQRILSERGIECLVVNAADIPVSDKEKKRKQDKIDARKLSRYLTEKRVQRIYIPQESWEHARTLVRTRCRLVNNQTRSKNRIWQLLYFSGLEMPQQKEAGQYWSRKFIASLEAMECKGSAHLQTSLRLHIQDYLQTRTLLLQATGAIRKLCEDAAYAADIKLLRSIPGIGVINAAIILFELQEINRFKGFDEICSYAGLIPDTHDTSDTKRQREITRRANQYLRTALVESSWQVVRKDPALLLKYKEYCKRMEKTKAIIRIAKHLLARIRYVLRNQKEYVAGIVG